MKFVLFNFFNYFMMSIFFEEIEGINITILFFFGFRIFVKVFRWLELIVNLRIRYYIERKSRVLIVKK